MKRIVPLLLLSLLASAAAFAQDPLKADPQHYKVEFENDKVRVLRVRIGARAKSPSHSHPDHVVVALTDTKVRHTSPDGKASEREAKAGATLWTPATTHAGENTGDKPFEVVIVELKSPATASASQAGDEAAIMRLEGEWADAVKRQDTGWMERHYAPDYTWTSPEGTVNDRRADIADAKNYSFDSLETTDTRVRVMGDTAVVTGVSAVRGKYKGQDFSGRYRFTDTLVRRDGRWVILASQYTRVAEQQASAK